MSTFTAAPPAAPRATTVHAQSMTERPAQTRLHPARMTEDAWWTLGGSAFGSLGLAWLVVERILPTSGVIAFFGFWYLSFVFLFVIAGALQASGEPILDRLAVLACRSAGAAVLGALIVVVGYTAYRGWTALRPSFFTQTMATTGPLDPLSQGGVAAAIVGSLEQVALALVICIPLGIATALYLNEVKGKLARVVRTLVDAMSAIPSIVAGLFVLATLILTLGVNRCGLAASIAIAIEMLPVVTRASELVFRLVPGGLREASLALGSSHWRSVRHVILPTARSGLITAVLLGIARGIGETAPVLLVAGFTADMNTNPLHNAQISFPLYIFTYVKYPQSVMITRAYGAALALLIIVLVLFVAARIFGGPAPGTLTKRQVRSIARSAAR
jgi:phosphate transport system permease protein